MKPLPPSDIDEIVQGIQWDFLRDARILATGCTGFFGPWILEPLLEANDQFGLNVRVTVLTRNPERFLGNLPHIAMHTCVSVLRGDVTFSPLGGPYTHIIHAAAPSDSSRETLTDRQMERMIVLGTSRVLVDTARKGMSRVLFVSSGAVYKQEQDGYAKGKQRAEVLCLNSGLDVVIARPFAFLAPGLPLDAHYAAGNFIRDALAGGPIKVLGHPRTKRSYLYGTDLSVALWRILQYGYNGWAYDVGSYKPVTIRELASRIAKKAGVSFEVVPPSDGSKPHPSVYLPYPTLSVPVVPAQSVGLDAAISRTLAWYKGE